MKTGLCSITFRKHSVDEVIDFAKSAELDGIEWGGDVHVPPGDLELARSVREKTEAAGLTIPSYGSYYRCNDDTEPFSDVLDTARTARYSDYAVRNTPDHVLSTYFQQQDDHYTLDEGDFAQAA